MPGYESNRFVNLSQNEKTELTCSICQDILFRPLVAQCCQQSFCGDCINDWLKNNSTCPYDRKVMTISGLSRPSRIMLNMFGKLKINCDYKENGCKEVLLLENLSQHIIKCRYNVEKCKKCLCGIQDKSSHDCIKTLLELNRKANLENEALKRNASAKSIDPIVPNTSGQLANNNLREQSLLRENIELKAEKENFLKTIQDLSNNREQQNSSNTSSFRISEQEIIKQARRHILTPEVIQIDMNEDIKNKVLSIVKEEIVKEYNSGYVFCENIKDKLDAEFGSSWFCIASHQQDITLSAKYDAGYLIRIKFAELYLVILRNK